MNLFSNFRCSSLTFNLQLSMGLDSLTIESQPRQIQDLPCFWKCPDILHMSIYPGRPRVLTCQYLARFYNCRDIRDSLEFGRDRRCSQHIHTSSTKTLGSGLTVSRRPCLWVIKVWTFIDLIKRTVKSSNSCPNSNINRRSWSWPWPS